MFNLKILKPDGSLIGTYANLDSCCRRLQALSETRGASYQVRARGIVDGGVYTGAILSVTDLLAALS